EPLRGRGEPASYSDALRASLGPTLYDALYAPYAVKLWGLPGTRIDPEQARRRVSADTPWKIAGRMLRQRIGGRIFGGRNFSGQSRGQGRIFHYPRRGFGQIVDALADAAVDAGADLRLATEVDQVRPTGDGVTVRTRDGEEFTAGHLFTTIPLPLLARITMPAPPASAVDAAAALRFRSMVLVYLVHEGRPWTGFDAHYLPGPDTPVSRISEPANYRISSDDPADRTVLCCEVPCQFGDRSWSADDGELAAVVADTLDRAGLPPVRGGEVVTRRLRTVYPVYEIGYAEHLAGLDAWAATLPRVTTFGRLGLFVHDNTHHAMAMAYDAVDALRDGYWDATAWSA
ncbi:MAG: FAD-dependent oxidoreductase, partial [Pseudonocardiaceae bacterium]